VVTNVLEETVASMFKVEHEHSNEPSSSIKGRAFLDQLNDYLLLKINSAPWQVGFEVLTAVRSKMAVFWVVAPCSLVEVYQRFIGLCCLQHQGARATTQKTAIFLIHGVERFLVEEEMSGDE
jgi:hypothetical protein